MYYIIAFLLGMVFNAIFKPITFDNADKIILFELQDAIKEKKKLQEENDALQKILYERTRRSP